MKQIAINCELELLFAILLTLQEGGAFNARPEQKLYFWHLLVIQMTRKKVDFSQISMTMPPILFWGLKRA